MSEVLGAILAGGQSTRYGAPKALAPIGGERLIDRVVQAVRAAVPEVVLIANDPALAAAAGLSWRADRLRGAGPLAGLHAALAWAREREARGILAVACDMPFLSPALLRRLAEPASADIVLPESEGRRGIEPLCAYYGVSCLDAIEAAVAEGDLRMIGFHEQLRVERLPLREVAAFGDPALLFMNVNTPEERIAAEMRVRGTDGHAP